MPSFEQRLCRLAQEAADAADPLHALETLVELRDELEAVTRAQVERGLRAGRSFADIARALGISRQAAHSRFRDLAVGGPREPSGRLAATERALRVLRVARDEALTGKAAAPGSAHVLIAVLRCGGAAANALLREGVTLETARTCERAMAADRGLASADGRAAGLRPVLRDAKGIAVARGERWLDVDAILLGALADPESGARGVLVALGVDVASVRSQLGWGTLPRSRRAGPLAANEARHARAA